MIRKVLSLVVEPVGHTGEAHSTQNEDSVAIGIVDRTVAVRATWSTAPRIHNLEDGSRGRVSRRVEHQGWAGGGISERERVSTWIARVCKTMYACTHTHIYIYYVEIYMHTSIAESHYQTCHDPIVCALSF